MPSSTLSIVSAEGPLLDRILDSTHEIWHDGLSRPAYGRYNAAQLKTPWGRAHLRRTALVDGDTVLASAKLYELCAALDGRRVRVIGIGALFTQPEQRGRGHARLLVERILERATHQGFAVALLFSEIGDEYYRRLGFTTIRTTDLMLRVLEPGDRGAPAIGVRAGDDRDLGAIAAMGRERAALYRFHLERDPDLIQYGLSKKRLLAGLGQAGARQVEFFVAEEGASPVAYVVVSVRSEVEWVLEECGDRDISGARVGAILQTLLAREPSERRRTIVARLPPGFLPSQLTIADTRPTAEVLMVRPLEPGAEAVKLLAAGDVLYWHADLF